jgi:hypothetical protein
MGLRIALLERRASVTLGIKAFSSLRLAVLAVVLVSVQGEADFSGTWILNKVHSDVSQALGLSDDPEQARNATMTMEVAQQGSDLRVTRIVNIRGREQREVHTYKTDGSETMNTGFRGETIIARAFREGDKLVVESTRTWRVLLHAFSAHSRGVWSLSPGGKTLTIDAQVQSLRGEQRLRAVFDKQ